MACRGKGTTDCVRRAAKVQVKITSKKSIALRHPCNHLVVLKMDQYGKEAEIVYDGPGASDMEARGAQEEAIEWAVPSEPLRHRGGEKKNTWRSRLK